MCFWIRYENQKIRSSFHVTVELGLVEVEAVELGAGGVVAEVEAEDVESTAWLPGSEATDNKKVFPLEYFSWFVQLLVGGPFRLWLSCRLDDEVMLISKLVLCLGVKKDPGDKMNHWSMKNKKQHWARFNQYGSFLRTLLHTRVSMNGFSHRQPKFCFQRLVVEVVLDPAGTRIACTIRAHH